MRYYNRQGGSLSRIRFFATPVNTAIVLINVIVFIVLEVMGDTTNSIFMINHGAQYWPLIKYGHEYWRLLTCTFLHFGFRHLINNMIVLLFIGDNLERALGKVKYLIFYLIVSIGSSFVSYYMNYSSGENIVSAGASGAIFGVVGGMLLIIILNKGRLEDLSIRNIGLFIVFSLYHGYSSAGVDNVAHLSGLAIGFVLAFLFYRRKKKKTDYYGGYNDNSYNNYNNDNYIHFQ